MTTATMTDDTTTTDATGEAIQVGANAFDIRRHDAVLTLVSPRTGEHRTFRVRSIHRGNLEGKRVVEMLEGPDNGSDYRAFAFVGDDGRVMVWKAYRGESGERSQWERFGDLLARPALWHARGVQYLISLNCRRCGRPLTHPASITDGLGPHCRTLA